MRIITKLGFWFLGFQKNIHAKLIDDDSGKDKDCARKTEDSEKERRKEEMKNRPTERL